MNWFVRMAEPRRNLVIGLDEALQQLLDSEEGYTSSVESEDEESVVRDPVRPSYDLECTIHEEINNRIESISTPDTSSTTSNTTNNTSSSTTTTSQAPQCRNTATPLSGSQNDVDPCSIRKGKPYSTKCWNGLVCIMCVYQY